MANRKHLTLLKMGVDAWNTWLTAPSLTCNGYLVHPFKNLLFPEYDISLFISILGEYMRLLRKWISCIPIFITRS